MAPSGVRGRPSRLNCAVPSAATLVEGVTACRQYSLMTWVGLRYYIGLLQDPLFLLTLRNTFLYAIGSLVFIPPLALGVALLLNARVRLQWLWRTLYFTPVVTSTVAVAIVWTHMFDANYGTVNALLG